MRSEIIKFVWFVGNEIRYLYIYFVQIPLNKKLDKWEESLEKRKNN
jgi:hypothetical protein